MSWLGSRQSPAARISSTPLTATPAPTAANPARPDDILDAVASDFLEIMPSLRFADAWARGGAPTFGYTLDWKSPMNDGALGSCHALDIPFAFGTHARRAGLRRNRPRCRRPGRHHARYLDHLRSHRQPRTSTVLNGRIRPYDVPAIAHANDAGCPISASKLHGARQSAAVWDGVF